MEKTQNQEEAATMLQIAAKKTGFSETQIKEGLSCAGKFFSQSPDVLNRALDSYDKTIGLKTEAEITKREIAKYEHIERVKIKEIQEKYSLMRAVFGELFAERRAAINKDFEVIDKGLRENDYTLIEKGLNSLSQVVTASPFADIVSFHKMLESDDQVIEL
jgi:DNA-binding transcriptional regulator YiaG